MLVTARHCRHLGGRVGRSGRWSGAGAHAASGLQDVGDVGGALLVMVRGATRLSRGRIKLSVVSCALSAAARDVQLVVLARVGVCPPWDAVLAALAWGVHGCGAGQGGRDERADLGG